MITLTSICKSIAGRVLFDDVTISFNERCRYGLTGPNGSGKSTLLKIMMGLEEATSGQIQMPKKVGFLKQNIEAFQEYTAIDTVIMGNKILWEALQKREALYEEEMTEEVGMELAHLEEIIGEEEGYVAEAEAETLLEGMGIEREFFPHKIKTLPLDQQFRCLLAQALFGNPQALLLDEPTNHLDLDSIRWLEKFLHDFEGTLIVVSHDKHFLNSITTHIADIDYETIIIYPGNYDQMLLAKTSVRKRSEDENKSREKKIAQLNEFVSRFSAGTRASQVQSRLREIERLEPQDLKESNIQRPYIRFIPPVIKGGQIVLKAENLAKSYENKQVISNFSLEVLRGEKIALIGNNGLGKTTLLKILSKQILPDQGTLSYGHEIKAGYFPQNHKDLLENVGEMNLFDYLKTVKEKLFDQDIRSVLGKMLFSGDDAFKKIGNLSGGETARLLLASLILQDINLLILDEPNNHLDLESVSALAWGLNEFKGTVLFASHDQTLISEVATKMVIFKKEGIKIFAGPYEEYTKSTN
jgi:ATPase subunit of ABC transporter with duplicated ATPase domains